MEILSTSHLKLYLSAVLEYMYVATVHLTTLYGFRLVLCNMLEDAADNQCIHRSVYQLLLSPGALSPFILFFSPDWRTPSTRDMELRWTKTPMDPETWFSLHLDLRIVQICQRNINMTFWHSGLVSEQFYKDLGKNTVLYLNTIMYLPCSVF